MAAQTPRPAKRRNFHRQTTRRRRFLQHRQREQRVALGTREAEPRT